MINVTQLTNELNPVMQDICGRIHEHPELGLQEFKTAQLVEDYIR